jgi:5-methyltetrahydrofolate--homocysteine methyltransferase
MVIIGEKINASIPTVKSIIQNRDQERLSTLAESQYKAGADFIDVNVGTGSGSGKDEIAAMQWAVETIQQQLDSPLCIDSADPKVLQTGLAFYRGDTCMINSTKGEQKSMEKLIPLAVKYQAQLVALPMDEKGIPTTVEDRLKVCEKIVKKSEEYGLSKNSLLFDPLVLPIATHNKQGLITLNTLISIKKNFPEAKTIMGLSNISYGLPQRKRLNAGFLSMAVYAGLDAVVLNPQDTELMNTLRAALALVGKDRHCRRYIRTFRNKK